MRLLKSMQFWVGAMLVLGAFVGVLIVADMLTPTRYTVMVAVKDIPAYTAVQAAYDQGYLTADSQAFSPALLQAVVTAEQLPAVLPDGVFVETVRAGEVLNRARIVTGDNAGRVRRLALALTNPELIIKTIPVDSATTPFIAVGDLVDIYTTIGTVRASELITAGLPVLPPGLATPAPTTAPEAAEEITVQPITLTLQLPVTKRVVVGAYVVRVNREQIPNPQYGAVTAGGQSPPPFIEGGVMSVDVLVSEHGAEELDWGIFNGKMTLAVRPALWRETWEAGQPFPTTPGYTWSDFEAAFWRVRDVPALIQGVWDVQQARQSPDR